MVCFEQKAFTIWVLVLAEDGHRLKHWSMHTGNFTQPMHGPLRDLVSHATHSVMLRPPYPQNAGEAAVEVPEVRVPSAFRSRLRQPIRRHQCCLRRRFPARRASRA